MKTLIVIGLLAAALSAQETVCFTYDGERTVPVSCRELPRKDQFREFTPPPHRSWASRHRTGLIVGSVVLGSVTGWFIAHETSVNCREYPLGENGVNAHCPKDGR